MCGIAGIVALEAGAPITAREIGTMLDRLAHRGPDGRACHVEDGLGLGHVRLSILDVAGGKQPLWNEDGTIGVSFNGEIFNYLELRQELLRAGHVFRTRSDTETLVHAYEAWGDDFVHHLNGQFAIALWDRRRRRLLLVRDRPGILPLFYARAGGRLLFASEIKALLPLLPPPRLDLVALDQIFTLWSPVSPRTPFEGIREVSPGHMLVIEHGRVHDRAYWDWTFPVNGDWLPGSTEAQAEELRGLLLEATRLRLRSDVPVGAYLSGGLDSSALVALMRSHQGTLLKTFSVGFEEASFDEGPYQQHMVERFSLDHHRRPCSNDDIASALPDTVFHTETPMLRTAPVPMRLLSGLARRQDCKVVLTGEGADEVLGGYDIFKEAKIRHFWATQPHSQWRTLLLHRLYPWLDDAGASGAAYLREYYGVGLEDPDAPLFSHLTRFRTTAHCKRFFSAATREALAMRAEDALGETLPAALGDWHPFNRSQYLELKTLMPGYLLNAQGDRMLMANGVEGRYPFLDHQVIAFAARLRPGVKMRVLDEKFLLKQAMRGMVPAPILDRSKQPYRAPDIPAFFGPRPPDYVDSLLGEASLRDSGYFDARKVGLLVEKARRGGALAPRDHMALVGVLTTQLWHHQFVAGARPGTPPAERRSPLSAGFT